jgi:hypothetical protein
MVGMGTRIYDTLVRRPSGFPRLIPIHTMTDTEGMPMTATETAPAPSPTALPELIADFHRDGWVVLPGVLPPDRSPAWRDAFLPLHERQIAVDPPNRGPHRWHCYLPFAAPFDDALLWAHPQVLEVVHGVLGSDAAATVIGSDTPRTGAIAQDVHQDLADLAGQEALATFCIGLNLALVPFTEENGPMELWPGSHRWPAVGVDRNAAVAGRPGLKPLLQPGDILLRDLRLWHRGTANRSRSPRPMLAVTYMASWFRFRMTPAAIPRARYEAMSETQRLLMRHCDIG